MKEKLKKNIHPVPAEEHYFTRRIYRRILLVFGIFCAGFTVLYLRIGLTGQTERPVRTAEQQMKYTLTAVSERGFIYDRQLKPLVNQLPVQESIIIPGPRNIAAVLDSVPSERRENAEELLRRGTPFHLSGVRLADSVPDVYSFETFQRTREDQPAPHITGYLNGDGTGVSGIEKSFDSLLASHTRKVEVVCSLDGIQQPIRGILPEVREQGSSLPGIALTLDRDIQAVIEEAGRDMLKKGAVVVMDPYSGELIASASFPTFSPLHLQEALTDTDGTPMINRAFLPFSVGSTFKVVTAAAALEAGIPMQEMTECKGWTNVSGQIFRCHKREGHGELDMLDAMKESCNPYFIHLGLAAGGPALLEMTKRFGFGQRTILADGMAVSAGTIPSASQMASPAAVANLSFGQGELTASPVQIARMMSAAVNGGWLVTPRLVLGETDGHSIFRETPPLRKRILSRDTAAQLQTFLIHCVMANDGQKALPSRVTAGGKTATAQTGRFDEDGNELEHGWFAGFFPAVNPEYVVVVLSENSGFGNRSAAPVFARIADEITALKQNQNAALER